MNLSITEKQTPGRREQTRAAKEEEDAGRTGRAG